MTAPTQSTQFSADCKVGDDGSLHLVGAFAVRADIAPASSELDQIVDLADHIGQLLKQKIAVITVECADQRAAQLVQEVAPQLHKHGSRPFTIITPYGRLKPNRTRLFDTKTGKTFIPSAKLWKTAQNRHIVTSLAQSACETSQDISFRKSKKKISQAARVESLLAHSTVWNLKQDEEQLLEKAQQKFIDKVLHEHGETLGKHGFLPPPSLKNDSCDEIIDVTFPEEIEEEAEAFYVHFTSEHRKNEVKNDCSDNNDGDGGGKRKPRHVPSDTILLQADEVVTKSQEVGRKMNKTFTATLETGTGRCEYLAARSSKSLQILVAAVLALVGLFSCKKLEIISDGATWIGHWIGRLTGLDVYHLLCWYHLTKRVLVGLSGLGAAKEERKLLERDILGLLWKGDVTGAIETLKKLLPRCRVPGRVEELVDYLIRKRSWIGDYEGRHAAGLWIASTRVEKWNDVAASERCKHRGMSWMESGVLAMALHAAEAKKIADQTTKMDAQNHTSP